MTNKEHADVQKSYIEQYQVEVAELKKALAVGVEALEKLLTPDSNGMIAEEALSTMRQTLGGESIDES